MGFADMIMPLPEKSSQQVMLAILFIGSIGFLAAGVYFSIKGSELAEKFFNTASGLMGISSVLQLKVSGWFDSIMKEYGDENKYPFGPPSHIVRQIIDNPDYPLQSAIWSNFFFNPQTGWWLGVTALALTICAAWA